MGDDDSDHQVAALWQSQETREEGTSLDAIRTRAHRLERRVFWRNAREYAGAVVVLAWVGISSWMETNAAIRIGGGLICLATLYVVYQMYTRGAVRTMAADLALIDCLDFHRTELVRQRDMFRNIWWWYILPFAPGVILVLIGRALEHPDQRLRAIGGAAFCGVMMVGIARLNQRAAQRIQRRVDSLDQEIQERGPNSPASSRRG